MVQTTLSATATAAAVGPAVLLAVADPVGTSIAVAIAATLVNGAITCLNLWISYREKSDNRQMESLKTLNVALTAERDGLKAESELLTDRVTALERERNRAVDRIGVLEDTLTDHDIKFRRWTEQGSASASETHTALNVRREDQP
jgi:uncharacterized protein YoxC